MLESLKTIVEIFPITLFLGIISSLGSFVGFIYKHFHTDDLEKDLKPNIINSVFKLVGLLLLSAVLVMLFFYQGLKELNIPIEEALNIFTSKLQAESMLLLTTLFFLFITVTWILHLAAQLFSVKKQRKWYIEKSNDSGDSIKLFLIRELNNGDILCHIEQNSSTLLRTYISKDALNYPTVVEHETMTRFTKLRNFIFTESYREKHIAKFSYKIIAFIIPISFMVFGMIQCINYRSVFLLFPYLIPFVFMLIFFWPVFQKISFRNEWTQWQKK
ncbi:hypothetical protein [Listeria ilorinensis]|uniref:hypothetical protein n=1 Tax=Listeria ilorinensis TaxID=2867439 RepID=UPI001EF6E4CD|nr:hypothetical protein [Listeria ilorinensis]